MGIYSNSRVAQPSDYGYDETLDSIMEDDKVIPCESEDLVEAGLDYIQTMQENYNSIFMHIGQAELQSLEESGQQMVYTEGVLSSIWNTIKNFLKKIWEKIKALFKRFMMIIDSYAKDDKEFLNKYRKELSRVTNLTDFEFKGYKWNTTAFNNTIKVLQNTAIDSSSYASYAEIVKMSNDELDKANEKFDDDLEQQRGVYIKDLGGSAGTYNKSEFLKELRELYRSGESEKQTLDAKDIGGVHTIITELATSKEIKKGVADAFKACKKSVEDDEKIVDKLQNTHIKTGLSDDKTKRVTDYTSSVKDTFDTYDDLSNSSMEHSKKYTEGINKHAEKMKNLGASESDISKMKESKANQVSKGASLVTKAEMSERKNKHLGYTLKWVRGLKEVLIDINTSYLQAWKDRSRQNKAIAIKMVYHKPKNEEMYLESSIHESYNGSYIGNNFLANIQLK